MKGIILAGGSGSRLAPLTQTISKQLLPVYDKPLLYYPLSVLLLAGLTEILIISTERDMPAIQSMFGDGHSLGISLSYKIQPSPDGLAHAFILGEEFLAGDSACLILGDNIFYGQGFPQLLQSAKAQCEDETGAVIFGYFVRDPERFGVIEFDQNNNVISLEEKPEIAKSNYAATGLYFYDNKVVEYAKSLQPSSRGELEITDLNNIYLAEQNLKVQLLGRGFAWLDAGTHDSLLEASQYVATIEKRQGLEVCSPVEIAWRQGLISDEQLKATAQSMIKSGYGEYLLNLLKERGAR